MSAAITPRPPTGWASCAHQLLAFMKEAAASHAFELSYMVHMTALMLPATLHALSSWTHPGTAHAILAAVFGGGAMLRMGLHFSGLKGADASRVWNQLTAIVPVACTFAIHATGRVLPVTALDLTFIAFCMAVVVFGMVALSDLPAYVLACLLAAHVASIPVFVVDDEPSLPGRSAALLLGAIAFGLIAGLRLRTMCGLHAPRVSSSRSSADRPIVLAAMCDELAAGAARLVDVREPRETAKGRLRGALLFPLSEMTEGAAPPLGMRPDGTTYYLYCAQGVRVHPARDLLLRQGFHAVALPEGLQHLLEFAEREPARTKAQLMLSSNAGGSTLSTTGGSGSDATATSDDPPDPETLAGAELNPGLSAALDKAARDLRLNDEAYGEYEVQGALGRGSFGVVSLVCERSSGALVVCKELSVRGMRPKELRQTATEVALQASLDHPHILPIIGVHEQPGVLLLILQYAPLGSLEERISMYESSSRVFSQPDVSRWVGQAAAALQYMHDQGILHRDLSTSNLLLNKDDDVLITDFGLSCTLKRGALERSTELQSKVGGSGDRDLQRTLLAKTTCGTPKCMSPELVEGKGYDRKSDLWSLGVAIFELLTLRCPFSAPSIGGLVAVIVAGKMDARGLERLEKSDARAELKRLVSDDGGLLDPSPAKRATLDDVLMCCPLGDGRCCPYK